MERVYTIVDSHAGWLNNKFKGGRVAVRKSLNKVEKRAERLKEIAVDELHFQYQEFFKQNYGYDTMPAEKAGLLKGTANESLFEVVDYIRALVPSKDIHLNILSLLELSEKRLLKKVERIVSPEWLRGVPVRKLPPHSYDDTAYAIFESKIKNGYGVVKDKVLEEVNKENKAVIMKVFNLKK